MWFRCIMPILLAITISGCAQHRASGPNDLGLIQHFAPETLPINISQLTPLTPETQRNEVLDKWIIRSDYLCNTHLSEISRGIRDTRLATDAAATVLSGLATILAPPGTKTALAGAATITLGVGSDIQTDLFNEQAGNVVIAAIRTLRGRARKALDENMQKPYANYPLSRGLRDVERYDRETCRLDDGLRELRTSLVNPLGPEEKRPSDPILPAPSAPPATSTPTTSGSFPPVMEPAPPVGPRRGGSQGGSSSARVNISGAGTAVVTSVLLPEQRMTDALPGAEMNITRDQGRKIKAGLCLSSNTAPDSFGPQARDQIQLFRQTTEGKRLATGRPGLSAAEASFLIIQGEVECDKCYKNAYERYQYDSESEVRTLLTQLNNAAPTDKRVDPASAPKRVCDLRSLITAVQISVPSLSQWTSAGGTLTPDFVSKLISLQPKSKIPGA